MESFGNEPNKAETSKSVSLLLRLGKDCRSKRFANPPCAILSSGNLKSRVTVTESCLVEGSSLQRRSHQSSAGVGRADPARRTAE